MFLNSLLVCFTLVSGVSTQYVLVQEKEPEKVESQTPQDQYENAVIYFDSELQAIFSNFKRINSDSSGSFQTFIVKNKNER